MGWFRPLPASAHLPGTALSLCTGSMCLGAVRTQVHAQVRPHPWRAGTVCLSCSSVPTPEQQWL